MPSQSDTVARYRERSMVRMIRMKLIKCGMLLSVFAAYHALTQTTQNASPYLRGATISENAGMIRIDANSPRPLVQILDALRQKYGWLVNYQDPQYITPQDLKSAPGSNSHSHIPAGGSFSVEFPAAAPDENKTLRLLVDSYNRSNNPGRFDVRRNAEGDFLIVGISTHDQRGAISSQQVLLDTSVTLAPGERSITDTVNLICEQVKAQSHSDVVVGVSPRSLLDHTTVKLGGTKLPAHELLLQSLMAVHRGLYWRLLFDPDSQTYFLNIHAMPR